jgi:hypothetical protein
MKCEHRTAKCILNNWEWERTAFIDKNFGYIINIIQDNLLTVPIFCTQTGCTQNKPKTKVRSAVNTFGIAEPRTLSLRTWELWYWARVKMSPGVTSQYGPVVIKGNHNYVRRIWPIIARDIRTETAAVFRDKLVAYDRPKIDIGSKNCLLTGVVTELH